MHTAKYPTIEHGLTGIRTTSNPAAQQRPLGKAYRLILSYEPKKHVAEEKVDEVACQADGVQAAVG